MVGSKASLPILIAHLLISSSSQYFYGCESDGNSMGFNNMPGTAYWAERLSVPESSQSEESCEVRNNTVYATMEKESSSNSVSNESPEFKCIADILNSNRSDNSYPCQRPEHPQIGRAEIIIHRPAPIIVRRPPTKVIIRHPPLVVKPSPVVFHRPPAKVLRPVFTNIHPQHIRVEPILVKVKKPLKKVFVKSSSYWNEHFTKR